MIAAGGCCFLPRPTALGGWRLLLLLRPAALHGLRWQLLPRPPALGSWVATSVAVRGARRLPVAAPLQLTARGGLQLLLLLRLTVLSPWPLLMGCAALHPRLRLLSQLVFLTLLLLLLMLLLLIAAGRSVTGCR